MRSGVAWGRGFILVSVMALACSVDGRRLTADQGGLTPGEGGAAGSSVGPDRGGAGGGGPDAVAALAVEPAALDFGGAVVGSPSRARLAVVNAGNAPLGVPVSSWLPGSDADYLILHDQCENGVPPAGRCDVRLQLVPSKEGPSAATLGVSSSGQSAEVALQATGLAAGPLTLAPAAGSSSDLGGVTLGASLEAAFDLSNPSADPSGPLSIALNETQFQLLPPGEGDCVPGASELASGQRCRVRVAFTPARRGAADATLLVSSALGSTALPLAGRGLLPAALGAPEAVSFGGVVVGGVGLLTLLVENVGDGPLELAGVALAEVPAPAGAADAGAPLEAFSVQNSDCGAGRVLAGGERCSVRLGFRPLSEQADQQTELVVSATGLTRNVVLSGSGLAEGALTLATAPGASASFGELPIGDSTTQHFIVQNPSAQPSGPLEISALGAYAVVSGALEGECQGGVTSLVDGQSCSVSVTFTPSERGPVDGALLVGSVLAGAAHLSLDGRGLAPPALALARAELDFGRVPTQAPVPQTVTVHNRGDLPLSGLQATLEAPGGAPVSGFSLLAPCSGELAAGAACELGLQFLPDAAQSYAAVLKLGGGTGGAVTTSASALLLGSAFARGSLELAAALGSSDFGDVLVGASSELAFTLANPGAVASGRITLSSSDNAFVVSEGDCNPEGSAGLVNGSSCTFSVRFTPATAEAATTTLSVQSSGAGETALTLTGRGRTAPRLTATGNRDFGSANVAEDELTSPQNEFTWTVTNDGDTATGPLVIDNANTDEFLVSDDTCQGASVAGHGTCTMLIRFRPAEAGARTATLDVTDPASAQTFQLVMTGIGIRIVGPGEPCLNATCATGECTGGVCCDRACVGSCQECNADGICVDQDERQSCGSGAGECFGVDRCLLPELEPCSGGDQCGSASCERRLNGQGPNDRICCLDTCDPGEQCSAQSGRCQLPTLGAGATCGAGLPSCAGGLTCQACPGGGSQCTPDGECCGAQINCGGGLCIPDAAGACCPDSPECPANLPACDPDDNRCKECVEDDDCGNNQVCDANECVCNGCQIGQTCFASGDANPNNPCQICSPFGSATGFSPNAGANCGAAPSECSAQDTCSAAGLCQPNHRTSGTTCSGGECDGAGSCEPLPNPFACNTADPPRTILPLDVLNIITSTTTPPTPLGGTIRDGVYAPTSIDVYNQAAEPTFAVREMTFEFSQGFAQIGYMTFVGTGAVLGGPELQFVGSVNTAGTSMRFDVAACDAGCEGFDDLVCNLPAAVPYTASVDSLVTFINEGDPNDGATIVTTYSRQ